MGERPRPLPGGAGAVRSHQTNRVRHVGFLARLALTWATIVAVIVLAVRADSWPVTVAAIVAVATRQIVLGLLIHEQVHDLGLPQCPGDALVNLLAGFPLLLLTVEGYAQVHLAHHKYYFTERDPDFVRKSGPAWAIPWNGSPGNGVPSRPRTSG